jgi:N-acyl homoserine lactone hydrolase
MEMDVIPPGTPVNVYESYDMMLKIKDMAEILLPLHEPEFASLDTIGQNFRSYNTVSQPNDPVECREN